MNNLLIRGGTVIDGTGVEPRRADLRVRGGFFTEVEREIAEVEDEHVIDARGREVLPGFIDAHSHDDAALFRPGALNPKLSQGVTTVVIGNCGHGCAPSGIGSALRDYSTPVLGRFPDEHYATFGHYLDALDRAPLATDTVALVPHAPLRSAVLGMERRPATVRETAETVGLLEDALGAGAAGLSFGLPYSPGNAAGSDELEAIAAAIARAGKLLVAHVRNEADLLASSLDEFLDLGRATGCSLHISHLKVTGRKNFGTMPAIVDKLQAARDDGLDVTADVYPYEAGSTTAATLFPSWTVDQGVDSLLEILADPLARRRALDEMRRPWDGALENYLHSLGPAKILLAGFDLKQNRPLDGMRLSDIAASRDQEATECLADLMQEEGGALTIVFFLADIEGIKTALAWPHTIIGSDGLPREDGYVHPRLFGTFPRVLTRYTGEGSVLSRHEAVHRMTGATANRFHLRSGVIAVEAPASFQIIDPARYSDRADFSSPRRVTTGLDTVVLSGEVVWGSDARQTGIGQLHRERNVQNRR